MVSESPFNTCCPRRWRPLLILAIGIFLLPAATSRAGEPVGGGPTQAPATEQFLPAELGRVVYRKNGQQARQIYIIGQSHRSAISGQGSAETVKIQAEIYRIEEWLIQEKQVELLLPEGFFRSVPQAPVSRPESLGERLRLDDQALETRLGNTRQFVNADLLLSARYPIHLGQIEDRQLYGKILERLREAGQESNLVDLAELAELQHQRTAAILQHIPEVVEAAFLNGTISTRHAILTLGLAHIDDVVKALQRGFLPRPTALDSPLVQGGEAETTLNLLAHDFGVTVIIPRSLLINDRALRLAQLAKE